MELKTSKSGLYYIEINESKLIFSRLLKTNDGYKYFVLSNPKGNNQTFTVDMMGIKNNEYLTQRIANKLRPVVRKHIDKNGIFLEKNMKKFENELKKVKLDSKDFKKKKKERVYRTPFVQVYSKKLNKYFLIKPETGEVGGFKKKEPFKNRTLMEKLDEKTEEVLKYLESKKGIKEMEKLVKEKFVKKSQEKGNGKGNSSSKKK